MSLDKVFQPLRIRNIEIPNRIVRTAHGTHLARETLPQAFIDYHLARARGGCGLSILEIAAVHPTSALTIFNFDDSIVPEYQKFMAAIRPTGMKVFQQLWHGGNLYPTLSGAAPWGASTVPGMATGAVPIPMTQAQIRELIDAFAGAARRCRDGGLDGVELHAAHGYLFHQFLSPLYNKRSDEYGGSLENRMRLLRETLIAVRAAVGPDFVVGIRVSASQTKGSVTEQELIEVIRALETQGLIDFLDASMGDYFRMDTMNGSMHDPAGYELPSASQLTAVSKVPRIVAGRFRTLEEAEQVLREGSADMVSMVRAQIADPELVRKTREGRVDEVRPCIGCNQGCIGGLHRWGKLGCLVNPAVGFETTLAEGLIRRSAAPRKVLIAGGGPAGMEAARVAALAGHRVVLAEASPRLGGTVNVAKRAPKLQGVGDIADWLEREVYRLGVEVRLNTYLEASDVRAEKADVVIIATGSQPRMDGVQIGFPADPARGCDLPHVVSSIDLLTDAARVPGRSAVVLDDVGHYEAIAAAEYLITHGAAVHFVTRHPNFAPAIEFTGRTVPALERLHKGEFTLHTRSLLVEIRRGECFIRPLQGERLQTLPADTVVLVTPNQPLRSLYEELRGEIASLHLIGDAHSPRDMQAAIGEGHRVAREIA
jgi:2,4-dienoyl-CoA reductase-like NADH-dependent reductase (Old Yellow Enzyme family)/thioredoxin reductase